MQIKTRELSKSSEEKLLAISPCDGRYYSKASELEEYFSESAIIRSRLMMEVRYIIYLSWVLKHHMSEEEVVFLTNLYENFKMDYAIRVKTIEGTTNHDNKAVEYFLKEKMQEYGFSEFHINHVHFGLTSYDIEHGGSLQYRLKGAYGNCLLPNYSKVLDMLFGLVDEYESVSMLAHTHGQPASPTKLGKEIEVFGDRLGNVLESKIWGLYEAKFGGATGNLNAHYFTYPEYNWSGEMKNFVEKNLGFTYQTCTTQIMNYDWLCSHFNNLVETNNILIDLCQDMWMYISMKYFKLKVKVEEVGSSAMPHKVNPIDFENAEGNLGLANAILIHMANKLAKSRMQRDLSDSTVLRYIGVAYSQILTALKSLQKGLSKVEANIDQINKDLNSDYSILTEAIVAVLIREGVGNAYDVIKIKVRTGKPMTSNDYCGLIQSLYEDKVIKSKVFKELIELKPVQYTGDA